MRNISTKTDNVGDTLPADDFNANLRSELQNLVLSAGFSLDPEGGPDTDVEMFGKSITLYSNASQYYVDSGAADAYVLARTGTIKALTSYIDGVIVVFKAANSNTGPSTINVDSLGVKDLVDNTGAALTGVEITSGQYIMARYNSSTDDFELLFKKSDSLSTWINSGDDLIPVTSGVGTLGSTTNLVEALYLGDANNIYLGSDQDMYIQHSGAHGYLRSGTGSLYIGTTNADIILFQTNNTSKWSISSAGDFVPILANTYNIGSATNEINNIFFGDSGTIFLGSDQDFSLYHDGSVAVLTNGTGSFSIANTTAEPIVFGTNGTFRWQVSPTGVWLPQTTSVYDIGSSSYKVLNIYLSGNIVNGNTSFTSAGIINTSGGLALDANTTITFRIATTSILNLSSSNLSPNTTAVYDLGTALTEYDNVYCVTLVESSDEVDKTDIEDTLGLDFILDLQPKSYKMNKGKNRNRKHGLVAQEVLSSVERLGKNNADFAAIVHDEESGKYGLSYSQFIAPIIKSIQELNEKIESIS